MLEFIRLWQTNIYFRESRKRRHIRDTVTLPVCRFSIKGASANLVCLFGGSGPVGELEV